MVRSYLGRPLGLVSKWVQNPDLLAYLEKHPELKLEKAKEIAEGVEYLHDQGVIHGDLRVGNVIVSDQGQAQISDFGIAQILDSSRFMTMTQSNIRFTAPELIPITEVNPSDGLPTRESDIFSLGMLFLQLFHGQDTETFKGLSKGLPYNHILYDIGLVKHIHKGERPLRKRYHDIEDKHWNLISSCWDGEPSKRPTIAEVRRAL